MDINHVYNKISIYDGNDMSIILSKPNGEKFNLVLDANSLIVPVEEAIDGIKGSILLDKFSNTLKYFDGLKWIEWTNTDNLLNDINAQLDDIRKKLKTKIDTVEYTSSKIPMAGIVDTTLNIVFPIDMNINNNPISGLSSTLPTGSISYYANKNGERLSNVRAYMLVKNQHEQNSRNGTKDKPYKSDTGWCVADGNYWEWNGRDGKIVKKVPNLNQNNYLKSISEFTKTNITNVDKNYGTVSDSLLSTSQLPKITVRINGKTMTDSYLIDGSNNNIGYPILERSDIKSSVSFYSSGSSVQHNHTVSVQSETIGSGQSHNHEIENLDIDHLSVVVLYNIADNTSGMSRTEALGKFVRKSGDTMTGSLNVIDLVKVYDNNYNSVISLVDSNSKELMNISANNNSILFNTAFPNQRLEIMKDGTIKVRELSTYSHTKTLYKGRRILTSINGQSSTSGTSEINLSTLPSGIPLPYPSLTPPTGWLKCNGQAFDKNKYPILGTIYTNGRLPDLRGVFVRGWSDDHNSIDVGREILSYQNWAIKPHKHVGSYDSYLQNMTKPNNEPDPQKTWGFTNESGYAGIDRSMGWDCRLGATTDGTNFYGINNGELVQNTMRPSNTAFIYIIKGE